MSSDLLNVVAKRMAERIDQVLTQDFAISAGVYGWPTCAKCNKPVDRVTQSQNMSTSGTSMVLIVECHGETEQVIIPGSVFECSHIKPNIRIDGLAFSGEKKLICK